MTQQHRSRRARLAAVSAAMRSQGFSWAEIAGRFQQEEGVTPLVAFRLAHGLTQRQLAQRWNDLFVTGDGSGAITDKQVSYWESWPHSGHEPSLKTLKRLARMFKCDISELVEDGRYGHLDAARRPAISDSKDLVGIEARPIPSDLTAELHYEQSAPGDASSRKEGSAGGGDDEDVKRRSLLSAGAALALGAGPPQQPRTVEALQAVSSGSLADLDVTVESLSELVSHYAVVVAKNPSTTVYDDLLSIRTHASSLIARTPRRSGRRHTDLVVATGWLSSLLAVAATDMGDHASALVWCADTEKRGLDSGHPELLGWGALTRALIAYYHGQAKRSAQLAVRGQSATTFGTVVHARLAAQEMRARAMLRDAHGMSRAKRMASQSIEKLSIDTDSVGGAFSIPLSDDPPYTATSLLLVGRYGEAVAMTRHVIDTVYRQNSRVLQEQPTKYGRSLLILGLGEAELGRIDEACEAGHLALDSSQPVWPTMVLAGQLHRTLKNSHPRDSQVLEYENHYLDASGATSRTIVTARDTPRRDSK